MPPDRGIEMSTIGIKEDSSTQGGSWSVRGELAYDDQPESAIRRWMSSFKRDPNRRLLPKYPVPGSVDDENRLEGGMGMHDVDGMRSSGDHHSHHDYGPHYFDLHAANLSTANTMLARELRGRHLQMIAIGGSIGELRKQKALCLFVCFGVAYLLLFYFAFFF